MQRVDQASGGGASGAPTFGRGRELALLDQHLPFGEPGVRSLLLLSRPGIGASHLLAAWVARRSASGAQVLRVEELLDADLRSRAEADPESARAELIDVIAAAADDSPIVIVVDHGDDLPAPALLLLDVLADIDARLGCAVVIVTNRWTEQLGRHGVPAEAALQALLGVLERHAPVPSVEVRPLEGEALRDAVRSLLPDASATATGALALETGGVVALARALHEAGAVREQSGIAAWACRLLERHPDARDLLLLAAMVPRGIPMSSGVVPPLDVDAASLHLDLHLEGEVKDDDSTDSTDSTDSRMRMPAAAVRAAVLAATSSAEQRSLRRSTIEQLERALGPHPVPELDLLDLPVEWPGIDRHEQRLRELDMLTELRRMQDDRQGALRAQVVIARLHELAGRPLDACAAWFSAMQDAATLGAALQLLTQRGAYVALREVNDNVLAAGVAAAMEVLADRAGDPELLACARLSRYWIDNDSARFRQLAADAGRAAPAGWALRNAAYVSYATGDAQAAIERLEQCLAHPRAAVDALLRIEAGELLGLAQESVVGPDVAMATLRATYAEAAARHFWRRAFSTASNLMGMLSTDGRPIEARAFARELVPQARRLGRRGQVGEVLASLAYAEVACGDISAADAAVREARASFGDLASTWYGQAYVTILASRVALELDDEPLARIELERARSLVRVQGERYLQDVLDLQDVRVALAGGGIRAGIATFEAGGLLDGDDALRAEAIVALQRAAQVAGDAWRATAGGLAIESRAAGSTEAFPLAIARRELAAPDDCSARRGVTDALRVHGLGLSALELELVDAVQATLIDGSTEPLAQVRATARSLGALRIEAVANRLLRERGVRAPARAGVRGDAPFTERELQVARLVREGLANKDVGARLGIASSTVARILANVYKRHGISGRGALIALLAEHGL